MTAEVKGLVERLRDPDYAREMQHLRSWSEIDRLFNQSADAIERLSQEVEELRRVGVKLRQNELDAMERALAAESRLAEKEG